MQQKEDQTMNKVKSLFAGMSVLLIAVTAEAVPLDPNDFASLGALPGGSFTLDTGAGGGGVIVNQGGGLPDIAVFTFDGGSTLAAGDTINVTGPNPLAILFQGSATIFGTIDVSGGNGVSAPFGAGGIGVAGGGNGGNGGPFSESNGLGPGGGLAGSTSAPSSGSGPGSGGGFGTEGGPVGAGGTSRAGGASYGDPLLNGLQAGSGGGGGGGSCCVGQNTTSDASGGGAGGGGLEIGAINLLDLQGAMILANGGDGGNFDRDGGGGSGGGIFIHAFDFNMDATSLIQANGGDGGTPDGLLGGCGGAGRIEIYTNIDGSSNVAGTIESLPGFAFGAGVCNPEESVFTVAALEGIGAPADDGGQGNNGGDTLPEPGAMAVLAFALCGLGLARRRKAS